MFSQIAESKLKERRWRANSEETIGERADDIDLIFARNEWDSFIVETIECFLSENGRHQSVVMAAFYKTVSEGNFAVLFKFDGKFYAVVATVDVLLKFRHKFPVVKQGEGFINIC